jgi:hypothetical protein
MALKDELTLYVVRSSSGRFRLVTEEMAVILEGDSWRELKRDFDHLLARETSSPVKVTICVGQPPARRALAMPPPSRPRMTAVQPHLAS